MTSVATPRASGRGGAVGLVLMGVFSVQIGAGVAVTLFDRLGPGGAAFVRLVFAAAILVAVWRPRVRGLTREQLTLAEQRAR